MSTLLIPKMAKKEVSGDSKDSKKKQRGNSLYLLGLSKRQMTRLHRAVRFARHPSLSAWLNRVVDDLLSEQEAIHGNLLTAPTHQEQRIINILQRTGTPMTAAHLAEDARMTEFVVICTLRDLIDAGIVEQVRQTKITSSARGATNPEYRLDPKYRPFAR